MWFERESPLRMKSRVWRRYGRADVTVRQAAGCKSVCGLGHVGWCHSKWRLTSQFLHDKWRRKTGRPAHTSPSRDAVWSDHSQWGSVCDCRHTWTPALQGQCGCGGHQTCDLCLYGLTTYWATGGPPGNQEEKTWRFTGEVQLYFMLPSQKADEWVTHYFMISAFKKKGLLGSFVYCATALQTDFRLIICTVNLLAIHVDCCVFSIEFSR